MVLLKMDITEMNIALGTHPINVTDLWAWEIATALSPFQEIEAAILAGAPFLGEGCDMSRNRRLKTTLWQPRLFRIQSGPFGRG